MKAQLAVKQLNKDLAKLKLDRANETKALQQVAAQEQQVLDSFQANPTISNLMPALNKMLALGMQEQQTKDKFDGMIAKDKQLGLKLLPQAKPALSHKQLNADRVALGLKPIASQPTHHGGSTGSTGGTKPPSGGSSTYGEPWSKGSGQLLGSDTSHYQSQATFEKAIAGTQFAAIKATEGTSYVDPSFKARWAELGKKVDQGKMSCRIAYLFLDKGNGTGQAQHFLKTLGINGKLKPGTRLALDWEASALSSPQTLKDAANYIHKVTGLWPLIYTSASQVSRAKAAVPNAPMWDAQWTNGRSNHNVPFVQYSDGPGYDHDVFNGSLASLRKFAGF